VPIEFIFLNVCLTVFYSNITDKKTTHVHEWFLANI